MKPKVDFTKVGRQTHELVAAHGPDGARRYAARLAAEALADGDLEDNAFWQAVERSLTIR